MEETQVELRLTKATRLTPTAGNNGEFALSFTHRVGRVEVVTEEVYHVGPVVETSEKLIDRNGVCRCFFCEKPPARATSKAVRLDVLRDYVGVATARRRRGLLPFFWPWGQATGGGTTAPAWVNPSKTLPALVVLAVVIAASAFAAEGDGFGEAIGESVGTIGDIIDTTIEFILGKKEGAILEGEDILLHSTVLLNANGAESIRGVILRGNLVPGETTQGTITLTMDRPLDGKRYELAFRSENRVVGASVGRALDEVLLMRSIIYEGDDLLTPRDGGLDLSATLDRDGDGYVSLLELRDGTTGLPAPRPESVGGSPFRLVVQFDPRVTGSGAEFAGERLHLRLIFQVSEVVG